MKVIFGTRGSALALAQTATVMQRFRAHHPEIAMEQRIIKTTGDHLQHAPLSDIGGLGAFTRELESALISGEIDVAVHSLKDLPTVQPPQLCLAAVAGRVSVADLLLSNYGYTLDTLPLNAIVGTSSLRRKVQLLRHRPDLTIKEIRGNLQTRINKLRNGDYDAIILAHAGMARLGLLTEPGIWEIPLSLMLPAPGQGALGLEIRNDDNTLRSLLLPLNDENAHSSVTCERETLRGFGGGCRSPLGAHAQCISGRITFSAFAANEETGRFVLITDTGAPYPPAPLGQSIGARLRKYLEETGRPISKSISFLCDKKIVVTRATHQSSRLTDTLRGSGALVLELPLLSMAPTGTSFDFHTIAADWLIFTSANAVHFFLNPSKDSPIPIPLPHGIRIGVIGEATAAALSYYGITPHLFPSVSTAEALSAALISAEPNPQGIKVVIPRSDKAIALLPDSLRDAGMDICTPVCYSTTSVLLTREQIDTLIHFQPDVMTFFSPSAVNSFVENSLPDILSSAKLKPAYASIGPTTSSSLQNHGISPILEAAEQSESSMINALINHFRTLSKH